MPHTIFINESRELSYELWFRNRDKSETKPVVASGLFTLINPSGSIVVPPTAVSVSNGNRATFLAKPSSGTAATGTYQEIWDLFVNNGSTVESFVNVDYLYLRSRT